MCFRGIILANKRCLSKQVAKFSVEKIGGSSCRYENESIIAGKPMVCKIIRKQCHHDILFAFYKIPSLVGDINPSGSRTSQGRLRWGAGGARIVLHTESLPSLLSSEGAFSGISDSLLQKTFLGAGPQTPKLPFSSITWRLIY